MQSPLGMGATGALAGAARKKCAVYLILAAAVCLGCLWFYVPMEVADALELAAETEAAEQAAENAAVTSNPDPIGDVGRWFEGAGQTIGNTVTDIGDTINPFSWGGDLLKTGLKYGSHAGAGGAVILSGMGIKNSSSDWKWKLFSTKWFAVYTIVLMLMTMLCLHFNPTAMDGLVLKGLGISAVVSAAVTCTLLWREPTFRVFPNALSPSGAFGMGPAQARSGARGRRGAAGALGSLAAGALGNAAVAAGQSTTAPPAWTPANPSPEGHDPPTRPRRHADRSRAASAPARSNISPRSGTARRLIEQKLQFSDHSLLLCLSAILLCVAVYCFIQESRSNDTKKSKAYIAKKHPVPIHGFS